MTFSETKFRRTSYLGISTLNLRPYVCTHTAVLSTRLSTKLSRTETTAIVITQDYSNENDRSADSRLCTGWIG